MGSPVKMTVGNSTAWVCCAMARMMVASGEAETTGDEAPETRRVCDSAT
jgi:hypothetical protein